MSRRGVRNGLAAFMVGLGLSACASPDQAKLSPEIKGLAEKVSLASVPFHPQAERDDCGPAALAMMLGWSGIKTNPATLAPAVYTPGREGTLQTDIVQATRRAGRLAAPVQTFDDLLTELDAGHPVLVLQNLGLKAWPVWHYAVAMGYDLKSQTLFLHSGRKARFATGFQDFKDSWRLSKNWALITMRPGDLPATVDETVALEAANGLEIAGQSKAAAAAYGAIIERWPDSLPALMGFGNARYAAGDVKAASTTFRHAVTLYPTAAEAWNNLAVSLSDQGRRDEALTAAKRAVNLGGPHQAAARKTLADLAKSAS